MKQGERGILWVLGVLVLVLLVGPIFMGGMMGPGFAGPGMMGWSTTAGSATNTSGWFWGLSMGLGGLMMLAFWGALIAGVVLLVRWAGGVSRSEPTSPPTAADDPLTIVRRRYAAGEIDQATYERLRAELVPHNSKPPAAEVAGLEL